MLSISYLLVLASICAEPSGHIALVSGDTQQDQCVCVLDVSSGQVARIGPGRGDGCPVWAPRGDRLAFTSAESGQAAVRITAPDGRDARRIDHAHPPTSRLAWAPGGGRLAYAAGEGADSRIVVYDLTTGTESEWGKGAAGLLSPAWITDEQLVAIGVAPGKKGASTDLYWVMPDEISPAPGIQPGGKAYVEWAPAPHPSGLGLAFESNDGGDREVFILSFQRGYLLDVSNHRAADWNPVWAPSGRWLAFESFRDGRRGVYRVNPERLLVLPVAPGDDADNWAPTWAPDGQWLAFVSTRSGNADLWAADVSGGELRQLTSGPAGDYAPAWRPRAGQ
ncbi:MAG: PD40 domain-containing protein [Candidatus Hydrogenedentes bacterium]|nr:PD40 domain-containing protein [Candidatus Hydrogenedentota bacterium]